MDYYNNIIQIIPGIFVSDNKITSSQNKLNDLNINYVININNIISEKKVTSFNILVNSNNQFYDTSELLKIDFNKTNDFIINALQNNSNILIADTNLNIPLLIVGAFLIRYLNLTYTETIYWIVKKSNIQGISKNICSQLFTFYTELN